MAAGWLHTWGHQRMSDYGNADGDMPSRILLRRADRCLIWCRCMPQIKRAHGVPAGTFDGVRAGVSGIHLLLGVDPELAGKEITALAPVDPRHNNSV